MPLFQSEEAMMMRVMAWERAKGELNSIRATLHDQRSYEEFSDFIDGFIRTMEENEFYLK